MSWVVWVSWLFDILSVWIYCVCLMIPCCFIWYLELFWYIWFFDIFGVLISWVFDVSGVWHLFLLISWTFWHLECLILWVVDISFLLGVSWALWDIGLFGYLGCLISRFVVILSFLLSWVFRVLGFWLYWCFLFLKCVLIILLFAFLSCC